MKNKTIFNINQIYRTVNQNQNHLILIKNVRIKPFKMKKNCFTLLTKIFRTNSNRNKVLSNQKIKNYLNKE